MNTTTMQTPAGPLTIVAHDGAVRAAGFTAEVADLLPLIHPSLRADPTPRPDLGLITAATRAYFDGELTAIDEIPVEQRTDGAFLAYAWRVMRDIKPGHPATYTSYAGLAGRPRAVRAAAAACARNAVALFVPCHRVLRTDGGLGGYRWGTGVKAWLLAHEGGSASSAIPR